MNLRESESRLGVAYWPELAVNYGYSQELFAFLAPVIFDLEHGSSDPTSERKFEEAQHFGRCWAFSRFGRVFKTEAHRLPFDAA